jgi:hypothetical protein
MGLPKDNPKGYEETALPRNAGKLSGKLALVHNAEDDNVLFQNMLQLTNALQLAGKQFEMMVYPQKTHHVGGAAERQMNQMMLDFLRFPVLRRPINGFRNHRGDTLGHTISRHHVERFGIAGLQKQVHMAIGAPELGPALPSGLH